MKILTKKKLVLLVLNLLLASHEGLSTANDEICVSIPPANPAVKACESDTSYFFHIADDTLEFDKQIYRETFRQALKDWTSYPRLLREDLTNALVEVWLSVPEINPSAAQARLVIKTNDGPILMILAGISLDDLQITNDNAAVFAADGYPHSLGYTAGELVIRGADGVSPTLLRAYLQQFNVELGDEFSPGWYAGSTDIFNETLAFERIRAHSMSRWFVNSVQLNQLFEWIAWRGLAFSFPLE